MRFFTESGNEVEVSEYEDTKLYLQQKARRNWVTKRNKIIKKFLIGFTIPIAVLVNLILLSLFIEFTGGFGIIFLICVAVGIVYAIKEI